MARPRKWLPGVPLKKPITLRYHKLPTIRGIRRFMKNGELSGVLKYKPLHPNTPVKDVLREHRAILSALVAQRQTALNPQIGLTAQRLLNETDPKTRKHRSQREVARMLKITQAKLQRQLRDWEDYRSARKHFLATWKKKPRPDSQ